MYLSLGGCEAGVRPVKQAGRQAKVPGWQRDRQEGVNSWTRCLGTLLKEDDSSISQTLIKQSGVTISRPQPKQRPSCSDKVGQPIHQSGDRELDRLNRNDSMTSRYRNARSLLLLRASSGRNKDGCEPSLGESCIEISGSV